MGVELRLVVRDKKSYYYCRMRTQMPQDELLNLIHICISVKVNCSMANISGWISTCISAYVQPQVGTIQISQKEQSFLNCQDIFISFLHE